MFLQTIEDKCFECVPPNLKSPVGLRENEEYFLLCDRTLIAPFSFGGPPRTRARLGAFGILLRHNINLFEMEVFVKIVEGNW